MSGDEVSSHAHVIEPGRFPVSSHAHSPSSDLRSLWWDGVRIPCSHGVRDLYVHVYGVWDNRGLVSCQGKYQLRVSYCRSIPSRGPPKLISPLSEETEVHISVRIGKQTCPVLL